MKNYFFVPLFLVIALFGWGCGDVPDGVVEADHYDDTVLELNVPSNFILTQYDTSFAISIKFPDSPFQRTVYAEVSTITGASLFEAPFSLTDDGSEESGDEISDDNVYTGIVIMNSEIPEGDYNLNIYLEDEEAETKLVVSKTFEFSSRTINYPPVISNLVLAESVSRGEVFVFTVDVSDFNGLEDVARVYFKLYRPNGTQSGDGAFQMVDNGDDEHFGDVTANDGTYSYKNSFGATSALGAWRFEFEAFDNSGALSNKIIQTIEVEQ